MDNKNLKKLGLKITLPRMKILQILENSPNHHLSAEEVYRQLTESGDEIALATVYRALTQFETAGLVKRHRFEGDYSVYELDQGLHHDHLVCVTCGRVEEFVDSAIEKRQEEIAFAAGYKMTHHNLNIYGICHHCQNNPSHI